MYNRKLFILICSILPLIPFVLISANDISQYNVNLLKWGGPEGTIPGTRQEWLSSHPVSPGKLPVIDSQDRQNADSTCINVVILVESMLYDTLTDEIFNYINNLDIDNYNGYVYSIDSLPAESIRVFLNDCYNNLKIEGALLIGNIDAAWVQVEDDFNQYGYAEWPCDYFYMDLNGVWFDNLDYSSGSPPDSGSDGIYDSHSGDQMPEIYVGRLMPNGMGDRIELLENYFAKNDNYRHHSIIPHQALVYIEDDWSEWAGQYAADVALAYSDTVVVSEPESTRVNDYKQRVMQPREWVSLFAHSWPGGHCFYYNNGSNVEYFWSDEYSSMIPPAAFYNFFCCSFARYTTSGYGAGRAIFTDSISIASIGSSKTGSMLDFNYFYQPLSENKSIGRSFKEWFEYIAGDGIDFYEFCWHAGMTLMGDPFITVKRQNVTGLQSDKYSDKNYAHGLISISEMENMLNRQSINVYDCQGRIVRSGSVKPGVYFIKIKGNVRVMKYIIPGN